MSARARVSLRTCVFGAAVGCAALCSAALAAERSDPLGQEIDLLGLTVCGDDQDPALGEKAARAVALRQRGYERYLQGASPECERVRYSTGPFAVEGVIQDDSGDYVALIITTDEGAKGYVILSPAVARD